MEMIQENFQTAAVTLPPGIKIPSNRREIRDSPIVNRSPLF
jgi:hypothetical protein